MKKTIVLYVLLFLSLVFVLISVAPLYAPSKNALGLTGLFNQFLIGMAAVYKTAVRSDLRIFHRYIACLGAIIFSALSFAMIATVIGLIFPWSLYFHYVANHAPSLNSLVYGSYLISSVVAVAYIYCCHRLAKKLASFFTKGKGNAGM